MAESSAGVIAQLGATLEEILAQAGASLVRLARAAEANATATLPWVAAADTVTVVAPDGVCVWLRQRCEGRATSESGEKTSDTKKCGGQ